MANSYSSLHLGAESKVTAEVAHNNGTTWAKISLWDQGALAEVIIFGTIDQLSDLVRQLDRAAILVQHDLADETPVSVVVEGVPF